MDDVFDYVSDPGFAPYVPSDPPPSTRRASELLVADKMVAPWPTHPAFAVVLDSKVIGGVDLEISEVDETGELGYAIARAHWGKGYATAAAGSVIDWAFRELGLAKVWASADVKNRPSWRVMEKLRMTREGVLRSNRKREGEYLDDVYYGILRDEWEARS